MADMGNCVLGSSSPPAPCGPQHPPRPPAAVIEPTRGGMVEQEQSAGVSGGREAGEASNKAGNRRACSS